MAKNYIIFGNCTKNYFLPLFLALTLIILIIINRFVETDDYKIYNELFEEYAIAAGELSVKIYPYIFKNINKEEKNKDIPKAKKCLHYILLILVSCLNQFSENSTISFDEDKNDFTNSYSNLFECRDSIILSLEMGLMILFSKLILKYEYFKHHIISIALFASFGIFCKIIINDYSLYTEGYSIFIELLSIVVEAFYYCYQKYLMDNLLFHFWDVAFIPGFSLTGFSTIKFVITYLLSKFDYSSIKDMETKMIMKIISIFLLHLIICPLSILIIYYFNPAFILIMFQTSSVMSSLIGKNSQRALYCIPLYICQFIFLLIYLEIIELNFCDLNKNTKRNIELRETQELLVTARDSTQGLEKIDINKDYNPDNKENEENSVEMK